MDRGERIEDRLPDTLSIASQRSLAELTEQERAVALERFQIIRSFLEADVALSRIAQLHPYTLRTLRRWVARYRAEGLAGLVKRERKDQGKRRKLTPEMEQ